MIYILHVNEINTGIQWSLHGGSSIQCSFKNSFNCGVTNHILFTKSFVKLISCHIIQFCLQINRYYAHAYFWWKWHCDHLTLTHCKTLLLEALNSTIKPGMRTTYLPKECIKLRIHLRTVCCKLSTVGIFDKHKGCLRLSGYHICLNFCSLSGSWKDFPILPTIFT